MVVYVRRGQLKRSKPISSYSNNYTSLRRTPRLEPSVDDRRPVTDPRTFPSCRTGRRPTSTDKYGVVGVREGSFSTALSRTSTHPWSSLRMVPFCKSQLPWCTRFFALLSYNTNPLEFFGSKQPLNVILYTIIFTFIVYLEFTKVIIDKEF